MFFGMYCDSSGGILAKEDLFVGGLRILRKAFFVERILWSNQW